MYGWSPWLMWLSSAVVLAILVWLIGAVNHGRGDRTDAPRRILDERMARGDIDRDEYRERLTALREG